LHQEPSVPSIAPIGPPLAEKRPPPIELTSQDAGVGRSPIGDPRAPSQAEFAGRRLRRQFSQAEQPPKRQGAGDTALARPGSPAPPASIVAAPTFTSQFLAQVIAQEVMPRDPRQEPNFAAQGIAAYQATAARTAIYLGPQESVRLVA
jgi:hypothetical protein